MANKVAPHVQQMVDPNLALKLDGQKGLLVKQTMRGCLQECLGCEAKSEFKIASTDWQYIDGMNITEAGMAQPDIMYAIEESSCCCRLCWRDGRSLQMVVSEGGEPGGQELVRFKKPLGCPLNLPVYYYYGTVDVPMCCFLPKMDTELPDGGSLGNSSEYVCDQNLWVPKLRYSEMGKPVYIVRPETCCGGCCISINCKGKGCCVVPFYFHDPETDAVIGGEYNGETTPQIRKVWSGWKKECCSTADTFALMFPDDIDANRKAGLLAMTFLIDFTVFERQDEQQS